MSDAKRLSETLGATASEDVLSRAWMQDLLDRLAAVEKGAEVIIPGGGRGSTMVSRENRVVDLTKTGSVRQRNISGTIVPVRSIEGRI